MASRFVVLCRVILPLFTTGYDAHKVEELYARQVCRFDGACMYVAQKRGSASKYYPLFQKNADLLWRFKEYLLPLI